MASKPVIYISGPMSGIENFNFPAFNDAADKIRALGFPCVNPADFGDASDKTWRDCLVRDIGMLMACDVVVTLSGANKSKGSRLETHVAQELGMEVTPLFVFLEENKNAAQAEA